MNATVTARADEVYLEFVMGLAPSQIDEKLDLAPGLSRRIVTKLWALESAAYDEEANRMGARRIRSRLRAIRREAGRAAGNVSDEELQKQRELDAWIEDVLGECEKRERKADRESQCSL